MDDTRTYNETAEKVASHELAIDKARTVLFPMGCDVKHTTLNEARLRSLEYHLLCLLNPGTRPPFDETPLRDTCIPFPEQARDARRWTARAVQDAQEYIAERGGQAAPQTVLVAIRSVLKAWVSIRRLRGEPVAQNSGRKDGICKSARHWQVITGVFRERDQSARAHLAQLHKDYPEVDWSQPSSKVDRDIEEIKKRKAALK